MNDLILLKAIFKKEIREMKSYLFNTLFSMITIYVIFILLFLGVKIISPSTFNLGNTLEGLIIGYYIWIFSILGYEICWHITEEARAGTLEQLSMTPFGLHKVLLYRTISTYIINLLWTIPLLFLMMITTGKFLNIDIISLFPLLLLTIFPSFGIGFILAGLGLIFKRIQATYQIFQFLFVFFIMAPSDKIFLFKFLPFSLGVRMIAQNMIHKVRIFEMNPVDFIILLFVFIFYFLTGFYIFSICEKKAKKLGVLGHY
ncbi:MAG: ABC transporter permease [candidate division WOR-3 bacterium]